jgi:polyisoprenoid-binding protein YceI
MTSQRILKTFQIIFVLGLLAILSSSAFAAETYKLDPTLTSVVFRAKYQGVTFAYGRFNGPTGSFVFDESSPANSSIEVLVNAKDVDTAVEKRDKHLKSPDFLNAEEQPLVFFKSTSVKKLNNNTYGVTGNLTLLGKSQPITVNAQHTGSGKDPWGNFLRGFETSFKIKRSEFGMNFMLNGVDDEVTITVSVTGIRQ